MNHDPFQIFLNLIHFDQSIFSKKSDLAQAQKKSDEIQNQEAYLDELIAASQTKLEQARQAVALKEKEMKIITDNEQDKKTKLTFVTTTKEYQSLTNEISRLAARQHAFEEEVLMAWHELETVQRHHEKIVHENKALLENLKEKKNELKAAMLVLNEQIEQSEQERPRMLKDVPDEWLEKYNAMRERVDDPVVPVAYESCSACFHSILEKDMVALRRRALLQCRSCFRFLYLPEARESTQP